MHRRVIPNAITIGRLCFLPVFVWVYSRQAPGASWAAAAIVLVLALSDVLDGWLARRYGWQSDLGRVLDPIADRVLFLVLVGALALFGTVPWWAVVPLIVRDGLMLAGAALMLFSHQQKPTIMRGGKLANFILVCGIQFFIIDVRAVAWPVYGVGAVLYLVSGSRYIWRQFDGGERARPSQRGSRSAE
jgi:cardiolipin synthase (CMP-forming)